MDDGKMKKYETGYLMGVFDLFHTGHLNLIENAADRCEHLIVGLLSQVKEWERIRFDCLFSGNDYEGNPLWEKEKAELEKLGSTIEFFPYTEGTSTSLIKAKIRGE